MHISAVRFSLLATWSGKTGKEQLTFEVPLQRTDKKVHSPPTAPALVPSPAFQGSGYLPMHWVPHLGLAQ